MIKNILFDFGGVLLNLDFKRTFQAFKELGCDNFEQLYSQYKAADIFKDLETGRILPEPFYEGLRQMLGKEVSDVQLQNAWNAMLLDYRQTSLDFLKPLSQRYQLYLLSNTNQIHYDYFSASLPKETNYVSLESFFTQAYFSHQIHLRKPDAAAYHFVLDDAGIVAEETLFIDDSYTNFPAAEAMGIHTHLLLPTERIEHLSVLAAP